jgi:phospholipase/carboxylesterase
MTGGWTGRRGEAAGLHYIEVVSEATCDGAPLVIGLHGRGSNAEDLAGLAPALDPGWRFLFPQAPQRLGVPGWGASFSWYEPIMSDEERQAAPQAGVRVSPQVLAAREQLQGFLRAVHAQFTVPPERSALLGFSQGAAMTLDTGLRSDPPYAALVAMSGYLPEADDLHAVLGAARDSALLLIHGIADDVLGIGIGRRARQVLEGAGLVPDYREFAMAHEVSEESLAAVAAFLRARLGDAAEAGAV